MIHNQPNKTHKHLKTMAIIPPSSPLYKMRGPVGSITVYERDGIVIARSLPDPGKRRKASPLQKLHLNSFQAQHALAKSMKRILIDRVWTKEKLTGGMTPYSYFIKCNRAAFGRTDHITFPELMEISHGPLLPAPAFSAFRDNDILKFKWDPSKTGWLASPDDRLNIMVLVNRKELHYIDINACRSDGTASIPLDTLPETAEGFVFWSSSNNETFSPSIHWTCYQETQP